MVSTALPGVLLLLNEQDSRNHRTAEVPCDKHQNQIPLLLCPVADTSKVCMKREACRGPLPVVSQLLGICVSSSEADIFFHLNLVRF